MTKHKKHGRRSKSKRNSQLLLKGIAPWALIVICCILGTMVLTGVTQAIEKKGLYQQKQQLSVGADRHAQGVDQWVKTQILALQELADNTSLQLYMSELKQYGHDETKVTDGLYQYTYLRHLLEAKAMEAKFWSPSPASEIGANVGLNGPSGVAIVDENNHLIVSTIAMPALKGDLKKFLETENTAEIAVSNIYSVDSGEHVVAFKIPIFAVQSEKDASVKIGMIVGVKDATQLLASLQRQYHAAESLETSLIDREGKSLVYMTPRVDSATWLGQSVDMLDDQVDVVAAYRHLGEVRIAKDEALNDVLVTGRAIDRTSWMLMHKIKYNVALSESIQKVREVWILGGATLLLIIGIVVGLVGYIKGWSRTNSIDRMIQEQEKQRHASQTLINTLVSAIDSRDPFTKNHSERVANLARDIAESLGVAPEKVRRVQEAGRLMNISRIFIGLDILNKETKLNNKEKNVIDSATLKGIELLESIDFHEPITEIIRHAYEHVDGSGLLGLVGEEILLEGRILAVANSFVSMRSPRSYRLLKTLDETLEILNQEAGTHYDKSIVVALVHYIENKGGREKWKDPEEIPSLWSRVANQAKCS